MVIANDSNQRGELFPLPNHLPHQLDIARSLICQRLKKMNLYRFSNIPDEILHEILQMFSYSGTPQIDS